MSSLRESMIEDLQLHGLAKNTQARYVEAVRHLAEFYHKPPDQISEEELRQYFLHLSNVKRVSPTTLNVALYRIKFFYEQTLHQPRKVLELVHPPSEHKLPVVAEIRGQMQRDVLAASSQGYRSAQELKGAADGKATAVYARAYSKDPDFYQFWKAMETLEASLDDKAWLILSTDSELLKYLKSGGQ